MDYTEVIRFLREYAQGGQRVVINYVATAANTTAASAERLRGLLETLPENVELRVFDLNPVRDAKLPCRASPNVTAFILSIQAGDQVGRVRYSKPVGQTHDLACGQMRADGQHVG